MSERRGSEGGSEGRTSLGQLQSLKTPGSGLGPPVHSLWELGAGSVLCW